MADIKVGKITHYYDKIGVAVVDLTNDLAVGDKIKISGEDKEFEQEVTSIQMDHQQVEKAKKGDSIGLKLDQPIQGKAEIYKLQ